MEQNGTSQKKKKKKKIQPAIAVKLYIPTSQSGNEIRNRTQSRTMTTGKEKPSLTT